MGRVPRVERRKYQLQYVWERHHEIKRLMLLGMKPVDIAEQLGCTPENICAVSGSELFKREMQVARAARDCAAIDVARAIQDIGPKCLSILNDVLDNNKDVLGEHAPIALRTHVAQDLLDRHGKTAKVKHIDGEIRHTHLATEETIQRIKDRAREIEAEFEVLKELFKYAVFDRIRYVNINTVFDHFVNIDRASRNFDGKFKRKISMSKGMADLLNLLNEAGTASADHESVAAIVPDISDIHLHVSALEEQLTLSTYSIDRHDPRELSCDTRGKR